MADLLLPSPLDDWCRAQLGAYQIVSTHDWPHGESRVWQITASGERYFIKNHRRVGKWQREVFAYENWVPHLADDAPRLVAVRDEEPYTLLLTALDGRCMEDVPLSDAQRAAAWEAAGRTLARLHCIKGEWLGAMDRDGQPQEATENRAGPFWARKFEDWIARGERGGILSAEEVTVARHVLDSADVLDSAPVVATHGDASPRNWIVSDAGQWCGTVDFEHARWNLPAVDFMRWYDHEFVAHPDLEAALWQGYGREPNTAERAQIQWMRLQGAVSGIVWSREHNDPAFEARNRAGLRRAWEQMQ